MLLAVIVGNSMIDSIVVVRGVLGHHPLEPTLEIREFINFHQGSNINITYFDYVDGFTIEWNDGLRFFLLVSTLRVRVYLDHSKNGSHLTDPKMFWEYTEKLLAPKFPRAQTYIEIISKNYILIKIAGLLTDFLRKQEKSLRHPSFTTFSQSNFFFLGHSEYQYLTFVQNVFK